MALTTRNNNNTLTVSKKQLGTIVASSVAGAIGNYVNNNSTGLLNAAVGLGKKAYNSVSRRNKRGNQQAIMHVGGGGGSIMAPVAVTRQPRGSKPKFSGKTAGSITIQHREFLTQVNNSTDLVVNGGIVGNLLQLNPLNATLFTWLPAIASNFDQYTFTSVVLTYEPLCGTVRDGRVMMYWDKDSEDLEPTDRASLWNYGVMKGTSTWAEATLRVPTDKIKRYCDDSSTVDHKLIDLGQLGVATYGGANTDAIGEIFISYTVTLYYPQPTSTLLSTKRLDLAGAVTTAEGPNYVLLSRTSTVITMTFRATGTFHLYGLYRCLTATVLGSSGGVTVNSVQVVDSVGTASTFFTNCTVNTLPAVVFFTTTGITSASVHCVRASRANNVNLI